MELRWEPPDFDGGAPVAGYRLDMVQVGSVLEDAADGTSSNGKVGRAASSTSLEDGPVVVLELLWKVRPSCGVGTKECHEGNSASSKMARLLLLMRRCNRHHLRSYP